MTDPKAPSEAKVSIDGDESTAFSEFSAVSIPQGQTMYAWDNLNVWNRNPKSGKGVAKQILKDVSGCVRSGQLLALMGASGAGKTTLLNILHFNAGKLHIEGHRVINGVPASASYISTNTAYVQQEDLFIPTLTVREHLIFTSRVRMSRKMKSSERMQSVDRIIHELGLAKCQDTRIGNPSIGKKGISGGEMKRLAFASEYLTNPVILFCDEPTSGLDSFMAQSVVKVMQKMAQEGKSIICTIHQPASEVFEMFDHIYLLSLGRVAFTGTIHEALEFFEIVGHPCPRNHNPADFFIFTLAVVPGDEENCRAKASRICDAYEICGQSKRIQSIVKYRADADENNKTGCMSRGSGGVGYRTNPCIQFAALFRRSVLCIVREPMLCWARILSTMFIAMLISLVFLGQEEDQSGVKSMNGTFVIMTAMIFVSCGLGVVFVLCDEAPVFLREHWNGMYRTDVYYVAKVLAETPVLALNSSLFVLIMYYIVGFNTHSVDRLFWCIAIAVGLGQVSSSVGYLMSNGMRTLTLALTVCPTFMLCTMTFSGFFLRDSTAPTYMSWIKFISWFYYGLELLFINQYDGLNITFDANAEVFQFKSGTQVLHFYDFDTKNWTRDFVLLGALFVGYHLLSFLFLLKRAYERV